MIEGKYNIGDKVIINRKLTPEGHWVETPEREVLIVEYKPTVSMGPAYVLEEAGQRLRICYWETDIVRLAND